MTLPKSSATLRPLGGCERLFLAVDKINGFNFGIAVSLGCRIAEARWRAAFEQARRRHPLLNAGINEDDPQAPYFACGAGLAIPMKFLERTSPAHWQRVMESSIAEPFDLAAGPLLRAIILEDERGCDLVLVANHVVIDGMGVIALVRDLVRALAGESLAELPVPPSADERAAMTRSTNAASEAPGWAVAETQPRNRTYASRNRKGKAAISTLRLSPEQTAGLLGYARREQTTIGAVLLAATASALRICCPQLREADVRVTTPIDARPYLGNPDDFVLSIISPRAIAPYPCEELAASARGIKQQIAPWQCAAAMAATYEGLAAVLTQKLDAGTLVNALAQGFAHDVGVSNLRTVEFPGASDELRIEAIWGPSVLVGYEGEHFIGSATFGRAMHLTYSSFTPAVGLLEAVGQMISEASRSVVA